MMDIVYGALVFGVAGWIGVGMGRRLCDGVESFEDGPTPISVAPWVLIGLTALVGVAVAVRQTPIAREFAIAGAAGALAGIAYADLRCGIVPDLLSLVPLTALIVAGALRGDAWIGLAALFAASPFALMAALTNGRGLGWGDVKLAALGGALIGPQASVLAFFMASLSALIACRLPALRGKPIALAPHLAGGIGATLFFGMGIS